MFKTKRAAKQVKYHAGRDGSPSRPSIPPVSVSKWYRISAGRFLGLLAAGAVCIAVLHAEERRPNLNVLLITADDLGDHSVGAFGGKPEGLTPNLDRLAGQGMRFFNAHVNAAICQPSRTVLGTGLYPHRSGGMGFMHANPGTPNVLPLFQKAGYLTGILGKVKHSTPCKEDKWDYSFDQLELGDGRSPTIYYQRCVDFFRKCQDEKKPFYFMVNSHDPHRPFQYRGPLENGAEAPSRYYTPSEVAVPGCVPDLPAVREELAAYQNSVRRLDDTVGKVLQALEESGAANNTLVMFLSDNGAAIPFAKCNTYLASTRTPWIVRWPGVVKPGSADKKHLISGIDFLPTVLDAAGIKSPERFDGKSFLPLLEGKEQAGREIVFTQIDRKSGGAAVPMRCAQSSHYAYIFTPWSDGVFRYSNNNEGETMKAMESAAKSSPEIAARVHLFRHRVPEEFYDLKEDPACLVNLISSPAHIKELDQMRNALGQWMKETNDPLLAAFLARDDVTKRVDLMKAALPDKKRAQKVEGEE